MIVYAVLAALCLSLVAGMGWKVYDAGEAAGEAKYKKAYEAADKKLADASAKAIQAANEEIIHMQAAHDAGEAKANARNASYKAKGASDVLNNAVFRNAVCVLPDVSLHNLNGARASVRTAADTGESSGTVRGTAAPGGRPDGEPLPANAGGSGTLGPVHPKPRSANRAG